MAEGSAKEFLWGVQCSPAASAAAAATQEDNALETALLTAGQDFVRQLVHSTFRDARCVARARFVNQPLV